MNDPEEATDPQRRSEGEREDDTHPPESTTPLTMGAKILCLNASSDSSAYVDLHSSLTLVPHARWMEELGPSPCSILTRLLRFGLAISTEDVHEAWQKLEQVSLSEGYVGSGELLLPVSDGSRQYACLSFLWKTSAYDAFKDILCDIGLAERLIRMYPYWKHPILGKGYIEAVLAVLQNLSEFRYPKGQPNRHLVNLFSAGLYDIACGFATDEDLPLRLRFFAHMIMANLAAHGCVFFSMASALTSEHAEYNRHQIRSSRPDSLPLLVSFAKKMAQLSTAQQGDLKLGYWITLVPHASLLLCDCFEIRYFALTSLGLIVTCRKYVRKLWKALALLGGIGVLTRLCTSDQEAEKVLALDLAKRLNVSAPSAPLDDGLCGRFRDLSDTSSVGLGGSLGIDGLYTDVVLAVDGKEMRVHRILLAQRWEHFSVMLRSGLRESNCDRVVIEDVSYPTFRTMIEFLYTRTLPWPYSVGDLLSLLSCADRFLVTDLKDRLELLLLDFIHLDNLDSFTELAAQLYCRRIRDRCLELAQRDQEAKKELEKISSSEQKPSERK